MGCLFTSHYSPFAYFFEKPSREPVEEQPKVYSWDVRKKVDTKDYSIENRNGETIVRLPGSINGMQFIIQNLENCSVYLFDFMSQVTIDDCKNCKFFIGPNKGSVFIRDCTDCNFAVICQQFRTRDCKRVTTYLYCATQPIIESSVNMKFGCISTSYSQLDDQLKSANISPFNNNWNNIHDFTPVPGESNHSFLRTESNMGAFIPLPPSDLCGQLQLSFTKDDSIIPITCGISFRSTEETCLVVIFVNGSTEEALIKQSIEAKTVIMAIKQNYQELVLVQTKSFRLSELSAENVFRSKQYNAYLQKGGIIGLEYNGVECSRKCLELTQNLNLGLVYVSQPSASLQHQIDNFYNFADMQMSV